MNEYKDLADSLNKGKDGIPRARRFRDNFQKIEKELSTGVRIPYLVKCLDAHGFKITVKAFKEELYRARKLLKEQAENKPVTENKVNTVITEKQVIFPHGEITNNEGKESTQLNEDEDEDLTPKQKRERTSNKYTGDSSNPFIKNVTKGNK